MTPFRANNEHGCLIKIVERDVQSGAMNGRAICCYKDKTYLHLGMTVSKLARVSGTTLTSPSPTLRQPYAWLNHSWLMQERDRHRETGERGGGNATSGSKAEAQPDLTIKNKKKEKKKERKKRKRKEEEKEKREKATTVGSSAGFEMHPV